MDPLMPVVMTLLGGGAWILRRIQSRTTAEVHPEPVDPRADERRVQACEEVVRFFANHLGYVAREQVSREEIATWIDGGATASELADRIWAALGDAKGIVLGEHPLGDGVLPVLLPQSLRSRHMYVIGKSGSGKTTLLRSLILQDLLAGHGLAVLAPEAEMLRDEILPCIPESRWNDVVYVDPSDTEKPVPLNPLHLEPHEDLDLKVDEIFTIFQRVYADEGGGAPRMEQILRQGLYLLMRIPGSSLLDFERLLDRQDPSFRTWAVSQVDDSETERFWLRTYSAYSKDAHLPLVSRLGRFLRPKVVRSLLCAPGCIGLREAMDEGKVLLFNLSDGLLGATNAELLGQLVVAKLQMAAMSRADAPKETRRSFSVYLDEFQTFCGVAATSYERILSRARKYNLGLILAHQQTGQIPEHLMREILGNVSTVVCFSVSATDARRLGREMVGEVDGEPVALDRQELLSLRVGEAWCRIARNVFFLQTRPAPIEGQSWVREEVVSRSRHQHGVEPGKPLSIPEPVTRADTAAPPADEAPQTRPKRPKEPVMSGHNGGPSGPASRPMAPEGPGPTPGRGGPKHKYLQELLRRWAEAHDWRATIEEQILDGLGSVDVSLRRGDVAVACEIAVTTTAEHELGNLQKCFAAGFDRVLVLSSEKKTLRAIRRLAGAAFSEEELERVTFGSPDEAFDALEALEAEVASTTGTLRGYKVNVKYGSGTRGEKNARRSAVSNVIARAMRRVASK